MSYFHIWNKSCNFVRIFCLNQLKMKKTIILAAFAAFCLNTMAQHSEPIKFGDFEHWAVRYIKESKMMGGNTRIIYAIAPTDTIRENKAFEYGKDGNPWSVSNAYAKVWGQEKASGTVRPEKRGNGTCCRMDVILDEVSVMGGKTNVLVSGTIFTGRTIEPIKSTDDPYQNIDYGMLYTKRPAALMFDYKALVSQENTMTQAVALSKKKELQGRDVPQAIVILQKRWEDKDGNILALRVGTAFEKIEETQEEWQNRHKTTIHYGDITKTPYYKDYMGLNQPHRAMNSKGKIVPIKEVGWATDADLPTHAIISISSGCHEAFIGHAGNTLWVDNVEWYFDK